MGKSAAIEELRQQISIAAPTTGRVLIHGDSGSGKELVARAIHARSTRAEGSFVEVNCAAVPEELIESELFGHDRGAFTGAVARRRGKFELADGGTLFLDEIGDMSLKTQAKVLRALEEQAFERVGGKETIRVDVRVLTASNQNLQELIGAGRFREDLFYRLNVIPIEVPALRKRKDDIPALVEHFIALFSAENGRRPKTMAAEALAFLPTTAGQCLPPARGWSARHHGPRDVIAWRISLRLSAPAEFCAHIRPATARPRRRARPSSAPTSWACCAENGT